MKCWEAMTGTTTIGMDADDNGGSRVGRGDGTGDLDCDRFVLTLHASIVFYCYGNDFHIKYAFRNVKIRGNPSRKGIFLRQTVLLDFLLVQKIIFFVVTNLLKVTNSPKIFLKGRKIYSDSHFYSES